MSGTSPAAVRRAALALPEVTEQDHHGFPSFRVRGKIFATLPDDRHLRLMPGEAAIHAVVAEHPQCCEPFWWGKRLAALAVDLPTAPPALVRELLAEAWAAKAPKSLVTEHVEPPSGGRRRGGRRVQ